MDKQLIEFVREKPEMYDVSSSGYSDNMYKNKAWEERGKKRNKGNLHILFKFKSCRLIII